MRQEEEFNKKLELLEQLTTKVYIHDTEYRMDSVKTQAAINDIKTYIDDLLVASITKTYIDDLLVASITAFAMETPPEGWLVCDGTEVSRIEFARLFERIGETFGNGDGSTTFNLPDLRGRFVRGWSAEGKDDDPKRNFGDYQPDQMQSHKHHDSGHEHSGKTSIEGEHKHDLKYSEDDDDGNKEGLLYSEDLDLYKDDDHIKNSGEHSHTLIIDRAKANLGNPTNSGAGEPRHGTETRVKNVTLLYCIKY